MKTNAEHRAELDADPGDPRHGTYRGYTIGCRCARCVEAGRLKSAEAKKRKHAALLAKCREENAKDKARERNRKRKAAEKAKRPKKDCCTVSAMYLPLMGKPSVSNIYGRCCVCGAPATNHHHIVPRSEGVIIRDGVEVPKPTILLCGEGNTSGCHGLAHQHLLHFRWHDAYQEHRDVNTVFVRYGVGAGHIEYLRTSEPTKYLDALGIGEGWRRVCTDID